jgi:hypothetical protein
MLFVRLAVIVVIRQLPLCAKYHLHFQDNRLTDGGEFSLTLYLPFTLTVILGGTHFCWRQITNKYFSSVQFSSVNASRFNMCSLPANDPQSEHETVERKCEILFYCCVEIRF